LRGSSGAGSPEELRVNIDMDTPLGTALVKTVRSEAGKSTESIGEAQFHPRHRAGGKLRRARLLRTSYHWPASHRATKEGHELATSHASPPASIARTPRLLASY
jgi:hypothetical protein